MFALQHISHPQVRLKQKGDPVSLTTLQGHRVLNSSTNNSNCVRHLLCASVMQCVFCHVVWEWIGFSLKFSLVKISIIKTSFDDEDASFYFLDTCSFELLLMRDFFFSHFSLMNFLLLLLTMKMHLLTCDNLFIRLFS